MLIIVDIFELFVLYNFNKTNYELTFNCTFSKLLRMHIICYSVAIFF